MNLKKPNDERHFVLTDADILRFMAAGVLFGLVIAILAPDILRLFKSWL